ncbi:sulfotransferase domain-containing protein [Thiorhodovibrio frisius]|uniref:Sulfotransferase family protein n=1 Tax=Thiorhodovibrio frisius TaxID=631362 RepID=H8Z7F8_9GAMM|nr:sulfotransferase domain-containing protein [Thiorhodovibrio frisius]EIC20888.1 sulfotransferase family protein [Thiorhodovibrio frisius]WPL21944.1 Glycolipid sulfotransferase [Thiorhodovibrio frisius]
MSTQQLAGTSRLERGEQPDPHWGEPHPLHDPWILANFQARPTDVLITTAPKAGTTWMQQILHQLCTGGDEAFKDIDGMVPWLERQRPPQTWRQVLEALETRAAPRLFKTHCTWEQTPGRDIARLILTVRDPCDCCISFYHHLMDMTDSALACHGLERPASLDAHVDAWLGFGAWFRNLASWWPQRERDNLLMLPYSDLKADLPAAITRIADFLGWPLTPQTRERAAHLSSFAWMKANSQRFAGRNADGSPMFRPGGFIRKGETGDHKTQLTPDQEARILRRCRQELPVECLAYLGLN